MNIVRLIVGSYNDAGYPSVTDNQTCFVILYSSMRTSAQGDYGYNLLKHLVVIYCSCSINREAKYCLQHYHIMYSRLLCCLYNTACILQFGDLLQIKAYCYALQNSIIIIVLKFAKILKFITKFITHKKCCFSECATLQNYFYTGSLPEMNVTTQSVVWALMK